jgi:hypothetical protein
VGFLGYLPQLFPAALAGLADEHESVRDVALRGARVMVRSHARRDPLVLLPGLEEGCTSEFWRLRLAAVNLIAVLLAEIDLQACAQLRDNWFVFRDRRPELYGSLLTFDGDGTV